MLWLYRVQLKVASSTLLEEALHCYRSANLFACAVKGHAVGATVQSLNVDLTHEEIIADRKVFDKALKQLHKLLGTPLRAPIVAGKDVDLHLLYKEVYRAAAPLPFRCGTMPSIKYITKLVGVHRL